MTTVLLGSPGPLSIDEQESVPVHYPGAVTDPETAELISDAEFAEAEYTAFSAATRSPTA